ncbi:Tif3 translation initiation factor [Scheffersomyces amazonensis]|uniref:Tif3 translation initiation factor n=1 Tax=Scheffersomyces amazonensis TaxID=1078765 RepID=UPI00315C739E
MAPPKKSIKMDLGSFLADDSLGGSWADEEVDLSSIGVTVSSTAAPVGGNFGGSGSNESSYGRGSSSSYGQNREGFEERRERKEFPIPDHPPYRAKASNLSWEVSEEQIKRHFESRMQLNDIITDVVLPLDRDNGRVKGYAFLTFTEREYLEEALNLNLSEFMNRQMYVQVAAPPRNEDGDWRSGRSGPLGRGQREEPDLDWGAARSTTATLPPRERSNRGEGRPNFERAPRRDEPDLDWGSARNTTGTLPPRERSERSERPDRPPRERKPEPEFDWDTARHSTATLPPRERSNRTERSDRPPRERKQEPEFDWGSARNSTATLPPRERSNRTNTERTIRTPKKEEAQFDWKRGQALPPRAKSNRSSSNTTPKKQQHEEKKEEQVKPQKSSFSVLAVEGDSDEEEEEQAEQKEEVEQKEEPSLEAATEKLTLDNTKEDGWEVVGK